VALITNDKGSVLVDTEFLKSTGLPVYSVSGGCFCVHIDLLESVLRQISSGMLPDVVIAEPIGSCIDLLATILTPINAGFSEVFDLAPLTAVIDPTRLTKFLARKGTNAETHLDYVFNKQLEQADILFLNKSDLLQLQEKQNLMNELKVLFPDKKILNGSALVSAEAQAVMEELLDYHWKSWSVDIDKSRHKQAEKELSWYSIAYQVTGAHSAQSLLQAIGRGIVRHFPGRDIAHLKLLAIATERALKVSFTGSDEKAYHVDGDEIAGDFLLIINARMQATTVEISGTVFSTMQSVAKKQHITVKKLTAGK
jgi:G3E family GTPase